MRRVDFYKLQASGNDFILIDNRRLKIKSSKLKSFAKKYCERKTSIGADGLLVIDPSKKAQFKMRIFNPDGSEPEMCGNGARCVALWANKARVNFDTKAGIIEARTKKRSGYADVRIKLSDPAGLKFDIPLKVLGRKITVHYINTGVPHAIVFVQGLEDIDIDNIGRAIRFHDKFSPKGTNVDFIEVKRSNLINLRTYERGVEAETLACGTGTVASAIIASHVLQRRSHKGAIRVLTRSTETLKVYFDKYDDVISDVWLEGRAYLVYKGELSV